MNEQEILTPELYEAVITWEDGSTSVSLPMSDRAAFEWVARQIAVRTAAGWTVRRTSQLPML